VGLECLVVYCKIVISNADDNYLMLAENLFVSGITLMPCHPKRRAKIKCSQKQRSPSLPIIIHHLS